MRDATYDNDDGRCSGKTLKRKNILPDYVIRREQDKMS